MIVPQRSTIKSRLHLEQSAFSQLVEFTLRNVVDEEIHVEGFVIKILELQQGDCVLIADEARHEFTASLYIERPQGWMPLKFTGDFKVGLGWRWKPAKNMPAISIVALKVNVDENAKVDVGWLKMGIPQVIKNKLLNNVNEQIPKIETRINQLIAANITRQLKDPILLKLPTHVPLQQPAIRIQRLDHFATLASNEMIFDVNVGAWSGLPQQLQKEKVELARADGPLQAEKSMLNFGVTYDIFSKLLAGKKISLGSRGELIINTFQCSHHDGSTMQFSVDVDGAVEGAITGLLQNMNGNLLQLEFKSFSLELKNKFLDFGASLFEGKIREKVESVLNEQLRAMQENGLQYLLEQIENLEDYVHVDGSGLAPGKFLINGEFTELGVVLSVETHVLSVIRVKDLSPWLKDRRV